MSRRPLLRLLEGGGVFSPARVTKSIVITPAAAGLTVTVTVDPTKGYVGTGFTISVHWSPTPVGTCTYDIDFGDGTTHATGTTAVAQPAVTVNHIYNSAGTFTITARITDGTTGGTGTGTASVQAAAALAVTFTADKTSGPVPLTVTFTINISGGYPGYSYDLDFGDGSAHATGTRTAAGSFTVSHTYSAAGTYTAKVTVDDTLGTTVSQTVSVGAGVTILFPRLRELFPGFFERVDKWRQRFPGPLVAQEV